MEHLNFAELSLSSNAAFAPFDHSNSFADTSFSLLYSWHKHFSYEYCSLGGTIIVTGIGINGEKVYIILKKHPDSSVDEALLLLYKLTRERGEPLIFEYVSESELDMYAAAAEKNGLNIIVSCDERYSDYVYKIEDYISLTGSANKSKRGGLNYLKRCYPDIKFALYNDEMYNDCMNIFDKWCNGKNCSDCHFGCEKEAFSLFMKIYDPIRHKIGLAYNNDEPLSFIVCEQINNNTVSCFFQKNAVRQRGLTYWLNREILQCFDNLKYLNLGEDMGLPGLMADKASLRPCEMKKKYTIEIN